MEKKIRCADDAALYEDIEFCMGEKTPVHKETEAQKKERQKREKEERRRKLLQDVKEATVAFFKKTANLIYAALITAIVGWLFYLIIGVS